MKILLFNCCFLLISTFGFTQDTTAKGPVLAINVPDFADPQVKQFYQSYADHLIKCVIAIRKGDEAKVIALFRNPGEQLVAKEKTLSKEVIRNKAEKEKYIQFATQVHGYLNEVKNSSYYQKLYGSH